MAGDPVVPSSAAKGEPAIHALVIGVAPYTTPELGGLDGASESAIAFADWLYEHQKLPGRKRGSIDVLTTDAAGKPVMWKGRELEAPTLANVVDAAEAFHERADENPDNLTVF